MTDTFDPDAFMNANVDAPMSTQMLLTPEGEYSAMVDDFDSSALRTVTFTDKNGAQQERKVLSIPYVLNDPALQAKLGRDRVVHREDYWLDFDANGALSTEEGKNVRLGQLRQALGQNAGPWAPGNLKGAGPLMIAIKHTSDKRDPTKKYANITKYAKVS